MTWASAPSATTPAWTATGSSTKTWTTPSTSYSSGNCGRFLDADPLLDGSGGVDFGNTFSTENPWIFSVYAPLSFRSTNRENPS